MNIPQSYNKTKCMVKNLGLHYDKIDACPNDCMLFRNDHKDDEFCHTCGASQYIQVSKVDSDLESSKKQHRVSAKTLRHFPLIRRLKRLFMCSKMEDSLRWHEEERSNDWKLRHPADGLAWKDFDRVHPDFTLDCRNVRLGLSSDGFNSFQTMSIHIAHGKLCWWFIFCRLGCAWNLNIPYFLYLYLDCDHLEMTLIFTYHHWHTS